MHSFITVFKDVATRFLSERHSCRCHFQFAIDFPFNLTWSNGNRFFQRPEYYINARVRDRSLPPRTCIDTCKTCLPLQSAHIINFSSMYRTHIALPHKKHTLEQTLLALVLQKSPCTTGCILAHSALTLKQR